MAQQVDPGATSTKDPKICSECGGSTPRLKRQRCSGCYQRLLRQERRPADWVDGRTSAARPQRPVADRLLAKISVDSNGCWIWTGAINRDSGYATFTAGPSTTVNGHRVSYETFVGPIADGLVIDHLCRVRACINPEHLEAVTQQENVLRSPVSMASRWAGRTHCTRGHEYTSENTRLVPRRDNPDKFYRQCQKCREHYRLAAKERRHVQP